MKDKIIEILKECVDHTAYGPGELTGLEEAAKQIDSLYPTLNRDKVDAILYDCFRFSDHYGESAKKASDALYSLSLPTLSEGEIEKEAKKRYREGFELIAHEAGFIAGANWAIEELTKPKEE
jgi:hypothetical protein